MSPTYLIEQRIERKRHDRMLVRIAQPEGPSHRILATVLAACAVTLAMMLAGCGGERSVTTLPDVDLAEVGSPDLVSSSPDLAKAAGYNPMSKLNDLAQSIPADLAVSGPVDMAQPVPTDMATCSVVPDCGAGGQSDCCNGALTCINWHCLNMPGQPCNLDYARGHIVACFQGPANAAPFGVCFQGPTGMGFCGQ